MQKSAFSFHEHVRVPGRVVGALGCCLDGFGLNSCPMPSRAALRKGLGQDVIIFDYEETSEHM